MKNYNKAISFLFGSLLVLSRVAFADAPTRVSGIHVEGNQRIETDAVLSYMTIKKGSMATQADIDQDLKNIFNSKLFADVHVERVGTMLRVRVVENPSINRVVFEGNKNITDKILEGEVQLKPRQLLTKDKVQFEVRRILEIYKHKGYFAAKVSPKIIKLDQNRVDVVFEVQEGVIAKIRAIKFVGNHRYSRDRLKSIITTTESAWWKFFSNTDVYDPNKLDMDSDNLRKFYRGKGYADFKVLSATAELVPEQDAFIITFTIEEGERYRFGAVTVDSNFPKLPASLFEKALKSKQGDWYSTDVIEKDTIALSELAGDHGYAFVNVRPLPIKDEEGHTVGITYKLEEGPKVFINKIKIKGNTRTIDRVIRRQFMVSEGDAYSASRLKASDRNIQNLGYFKKVDIGQEPVDDNKDQVDITADVEEQSTGEINFSIGYSTLDGPLGMIQIKERNLFGRAYSFGGRVQMAKKSRNIDISLADPYFLNKDLEVGIGVDYGRRDQESESSYTRNNIGARTWIGYNLSEFLGQRWSYTVSQDRIEHVKQDAAPQIKEQEGKATSSIIGHRLMYDRRDFRFAPTEGYAITLSNDFAGLGGTIKYQRHTLGGAIYYTPIDEVTAHLDGEIGMISGFGKKKLRIIDKFTLGGNDLRGFEYAGVGPRSKSGNFDALGGDRFMTLSAEVTFPLGLPSEVGLKGCAFVDTGTTWDSKMKDDTVYNSKSFRASAGFGFGWATPMGLIRLDFGFPLAKQKGDKTQVVLLNFGTGRF
jgi:outer membrane protein insertion porin family